MEVYICKMIQNRQKMTQSFSKVYGANGATRAGAAIKILPRIISTSNSQEVNLKGKQSCFVNLFAPDEVIGITRRHLCILPKCFFQYSEVSVCLWHYLQLAAPQIG